MSFPLSHKVPPSECPACGKVNDRASGALKGKCLDVAPSPGDLSVCIGCGAVVEFGPQLQLTLVPQDRLAAADMVNARALQSAMRQLLGLPVKS